MSTNASKIIVLIIIWGSFFALVWAWNNPSSNPPAGGGVLGTDSDIQLLVSTSTKIRVLNESATKTNFTQGLINAGVNIVTEYTDGAYTPGLFWSTSNNNPTKPKAGVFLQEVANVTRLIIGTSDNFATGITREVIITEKGEVQTLAASPNPAGVGRLWGKGRPDPVGNAPTVRGNLTGGGECTYQGLKMGRSNHMATWDGAADACPVGWWVCTALERDNDGVAGAPTCDSDGLVDDNPPAGETVADCVGSANGNECRSWVADNATYREGWTIGAKRTGVCTNAACGSSDSLCWLARLKCQYRSVWCCAYP